MPIIEIKVSEATHSEIVNALNANGKKINPGESFTVTKDVSIIGPIDWRAVQVRRDVMAEVVKVYEPRMNENGDKCLTDSHHFIAFLDDVYNYILRGDKPKPAEQKSNVTPIKPPEKPKSGW